MRYFQHTEQQAEVMVVVIISWLVLSTYFTTWFKTYPLQCVAITVALLAALRWVSAGPWAKFLPGNARAVEDFKGRPLESRPWHGKVAVITGGSGVGIGFETARQVALLGAHVIIIDIETPAQAQATSIARIKAADKHASVAYIQMDVADLAKTGAKAKEIVSTACKLRGNNNNNNNNASENKKCIDYLVNNAGIGDGNKRQFTAQGFERQFQVNYLGAYCLTEWLLPHIVDSGEGGRIVNLASCAHDWFYIYPTSENKITKILRCIEHVNDPSLELFSNIQPYAVSKFCNLIHASQLAKRFAGDDKNKNKRRIITASNHPGGVWSQIWRNVKPPLLKAALNCVMFMGFKRPVEGSQTTLHCLTAGNIVSGSFYADCAPYRPRDAALDEEIWEAVEQWTKKAIVKYLP